MSAWKDTSGCWILAVVPMAPTMMIGSSRRDVYKRQLLQTMAEDVELGDPFYTAMERSGSFPAYVVRMAKLGQQSGTLDRLMESLSVYYEKEYFMMKNIRNAITYPVMMVVMLLAVSYTHLAI